MYFFPSKLYFKLLSAFLLTFVLFSVNQAVYSQKKKPAPRQTVQNRTVDKPENITKTKTAARKLTPAELRKQAEEKNKAEAEAAKRRADQQTALEAKRRREQAIRAAQDRKLAFENSLRIETITNIARDDAANEDLEIRRAAINALGNRAGTIVVMEAQTGKILTIVN
jgi:hypothetical protein